VCYTGLFMSTVTRELTDVDEVEHGNFLTTKVDALSNWARKNSLWPYPFGTACCAIEFMAVAGAHYDIARFGSEVVRFSPRQSDVLMVLGTINDKMAPVLKKIYDQMAEPRWVISMGACATCGGFYRAYHVMQGIDEIIPVDVYIPGCPPVPEAVFDAIIKLQNQIQTDTRKSYERHPRHQTLEPALLDASVHPVEPPSRPLVRFLGERQEVEGPVADAFRRLLPEEVIGMREFRGDLTVSVRKDNVSRVLRTLKDDPAFDFSLLLDVTALTTWTSARSATTSSTTWCPWERSAGCGSACPYRPTSPRSTRPPASGRERTGPSARPSTCSASGSGAIPTCGGS
jgi:NADH-quinone oxidoreductase subunit B